MNTTVFDVEFSRKALKQTKKLPKNLQIKLALRDWVYFVKNKGLLAAQQYPGYKDEALSGDRTGQRSARLNKAYRIIDKLKSNKAVTFVNIEEVNKHAY
ncbi:MAG: hypothetical protein COV52_05695 [Gammaproteobacteria bacterium CG11_big_fil_rev_8_21_14_0_20_46_22]|nr:MAG: hypothetical protein COW05_07965 [Gammaproteobacteria bacterium CG12_big_fil_rev_8_21_14_0_65_46_12]PIR10998.1 MAG: hypothetical protein COV52_05695 [Gammaproteobacteria bacterium CG11_big_fil_rev_8_21_14_0_20_46_22]